MTTLRKNKKTENERRFLLTIGVLAAIAMLLYMASFEMKIFSRAAGYDQCNLQWAVPAPGSTIPGGPRGERAVGIFWNETLGMQGSVDSEVYFIPAYNGVPNSQAIIVNFNPPTSIQGFDWDCEPSRPGREYRTIYFVGPPEDDDGEEPPAPPPPPPPVPAPPFDFFDNPCERITIHWRDVSSDEDGFHVWRNTTGGTNLADYRRLDKPANNTSNTDTTPPLAANTGYFFIVTSHKGGVESEIHSSWPQGPITNVPCVPNLTGSGKKIDQVNGAVYTGQTLRNKDVVKFKIIIRNSPPADGTAYNVYVRDTLSSTLFYLGNARLNKGSGANLVDCSQNGQVLTCDAGKNLGDKQVGGNDWILTFETRLNSEATRPLDFFENKATIFYANREDGPQNNTVEVTPGLVPFRTGKGTPGFVEVAP